MLTTSSSLNCRGCQLAEPRNPACGCPAGKPSSPTASRGRTSGRTPSPSYASPVASSRCSAHRATTASPVTRSSGKAWSCTAFTKSSTPRLTPGSANGRQMAEEYPGPRTPASQAAAAVLLGISSSPSTMRLLSALLTTSSGTSRPNFRRSRTIDRSRAHCGTKYGTAALWVHRGALDPRSNRAVGLHA